MDISQSLLENLYVKKHMAAEQISKILKVSPSSIYKVLRKYNIRIRKPKEYLLAKYSNLNIPRIIKLYTEKHQAIYKIAKKFNVDASVIRRILVQQGIRIKSTRELKLPPNFKEPSKHELYDLYVSKKLRIVDIANKYRIAYDTARNLLIKNNIPRRKYYVYRMQEGSIVPTKEHLYELYVNQYLSIEGIAERLHISTITVSRKLLKYGIKKRGISKARLPKHFIPPTKEELESLYVFENRSSLEIGERYNVSHRYIISLLRRYQIKVKENIFTRKNHIVKCKDGHAVRSSQERLIDDWLFENGILHYYEKQIPNTKKSADFYIPNIDLYIEFLGLNGKDFYDERNKNKEDIYKKLSLNYIFIYPSKKSKEIENQLLFLIPLCSKTQATLNQF